MKIKKYKQIRVCQCDMLFFFEKIFLKMSLHIIGKIERRGSRYFLGGNVYF